MAERTFTRKQVLAGAAVGVVGGIGIYELVDQLAGSAPERPAVLPGVAAPEQHLLDGIRVIHDNNVEVLVPPLHHEMVTANVAVDPADLRDAQQQLEQALAELNESYVSSPAGLGITVAWGLPYFDRYVPAAAAAHLPLDRRAGKAALLPARRFPSDPGDTVLEQNELAILLRSDVPANIDDARERIAATKTLTFTSRRRGFAGGGFPGQTGSLPKKMAVAAGVPGADLIPEGSELFLGFTSTQKAGFGPGRIANFETLGYVDVRGSAYFRHGTHMHLSHLTEDLEAWYLNFTFQQRVDTAFRPNLDVEANVQTVPQGPRDVSNSRDVSRDFRRYNRIGHSASLQTATRLNDPVTGPDGTRYEKGTAIPIRADFNTLDNPFLWSSRAGEVGDGPAAGLHFAIFNPSSDDFERGRLAMDGVLPTGEKLDLPPRAGGQGFNSILRTTHRQNFLVPPRAHRSFPLAEL